MQTYSLAKVGSSPRWYVTWATGGRSFRRSTGCTDRQEAEAFAAAFRLTVETAPDIDLTVSDALTFYRAQKSVVSADTADRITGRLKAFFGSTPLMSAGPARQSLYVEHRRKQGVKDETIRRELGVLSAAFRYTKKFKELDRAPEVITLPASEPKERWITRSEAAVIFRHLRTGWTPDGPRALKKHASHPNRDLTRHLLLFARLALFTGARTSAILELTWDRVDLERGLIDYNIPGRKTTNKRRVIARIGPELVRALQAQKRRAQTKYVIEFRGKKVGRVGRAMRNHLDRLGFEDVSANTLRHSFATWAARKGIPLHHIGGALGHTTASTTARYAKHHPDALREAFDAVRRR